MDENPQNPPLDCHFSSEIVFFSSEILSKNRGKKIKAGFRWLDSESRIVKQKLLNVKMLTLHTTFAISIATSFAASGRESAMRISAN